MKLLLTTRISKNTPPRYRPNFQNRLTCWAMALWAGWRFDRFEALSGWLIAPLPHHPLTHWPYALAAIGQGPGSLAALALGP